jgi:hypothetical protein
MLGRFGPSVREALVEAESDTIGHPTILKRVTDAVREQSHAATPCDTVEICAELSAWAEENEPATRGCGIVARTMPPLVRYVNETLYELIDDFVGQLLATVACSRRQEDLEIASDQLASALSVCAASELCDMVREELGAGGSEDGSPLTKAARPDAPAAGAEKC